VDLYLLIFGFFLIAMIYSSVGFGGGSSYLAILATLTALAPDELRPIALVCNIVVVTAGTIIFYREGHIDIKKCWPFLVASIPAAYIGGYLKISDRTFFILLGTSLVIAAIFLMIQPEKLTPRKSESAVLNATLGGGIGFLSGLVGIGGGIFLSPALHIIKWDDARRISALASMYILVNSISGLAGQLSRNAQINFGYILPLAFAVFAGGQVGSRLGARRFNPIYIKRITAALVFIAGVNVLKDQLL
jgi:uncharacterized membrane protein YfcA